MIKIDSHQHFWRYDPIRDAWINNEMQLIRQDFFPEDLKVELDKHDIDGCIAVQADQSEAENAFLIELAATNPFIKGIVGWVDLQADNVEETLEFYKQYNIVKGFRHILQNEPDRALMLRPEFKRGLSLLNKYDFTFDLLIFQDQLLYASELCQLFPSQKFILDHMAKPAIKDQKINNWETDIRTLAGNPNVFCKISGMVTESDWQNWKDADFKPYLDVAFDAFGIGRVMFGSDWPVCNVAGGYDSMISIVKSYATQFTAEEQAGFWGENASNVYRIDK